MNNVLVKSFYGQEILPFIDQLASLRIIVFHDFPYLYEGSYEYEKNYLKIYTESKESVMVGAFLNNQLIGAATAIPLKDEADYVKKPFLEGNIDVNSIYYFGESILLKEYRGLGLGHKFFEGRENAAKKFNYQFASFCGVVRPSDHPMRPKDFRPLDEFWMKRGFKKIDNLQSEFSWPDIGEKEESKKKMQYWMRELK